MSKFQIQLLENCIKSSSFDLHRNTLGNRGGKHLLNYKLHICLTLGETKRWFWRKDAQVLVSGLLFNCPYLIKSDRRKARSNLMDWLTMVSIWFTKRPFIKKKIMIITRIGCSVLNYPDLIEVDRRITRYFCCSVDGLADSEGQKTEPYFYAVF